MGNTDSKVEKRPNVKVVKVKRVKVNERDVLRSSNQKISSSHKISNNQKVLDNLKILNDINSLNNQEIVSPVPIRPSTEYNNYYNERPKNNITEYSNLPNISNMVNYDFENKELNLSYENVNDTVNRYKKEHKEEKAKFNEYMSRKEKYLESQIYNFEKKYDPYKILDISPKVSDPDIIKKAYKKKALLYHPDRVSNESQKVIEESSVRFKIITQAYLYLLKKYEAENDIQIKINRPVEKKEYQDIGDKRENKFINKDKFNLELFNEVFEKYRVPETVEDGYNHLMSKDEYVKNEEETGMFSNNFNVDIFNKTFDSYKGGKQQDKIIEYYEPEAINSADSMGFQELGIIKNNNFENKNQSSRISYTDWKTAHIDENVFINDKSINYKQYKDLKELEHERANIKTMTVEEKRQKELYDQYLVDKENKRLENLKHIDGKITEHYNKLNKKLIK